MEINNQKMSGIDLVIVIITIILLAFPGWVRSGDFRQSLTPYPFLTIIALFLFLLVPIFSGDSYYSGCALVRERLIKIMRDPIFYLGGAFLCQLYIQWWNSGKVRIWEQGMDKIKFSPPYIDWMPGAVAHLFSWDMVVWFSPAFVALLIIRNGYFGRKAVRILFWGMIVNASLLAIHALISYQMIKNYPVFITSDIISSNIPQKPVFSFPTFGYINHAGSFFILHLGLACGLFFHYCKDRKQARHSLHKSGILIGVILLFFYAVHLSRSRYAILFSWILVVLFLSFFLYESVWKCNAQRLKPALISIGIIILFVSVSFGLYLTAKSDILPKLSALSKPGKFIEDQFDLKFWQIVAAAKIWKDYPVFGIGGGGYAEYLLQYVKDPKKRYIAKNYRGMANVHNDFMQFLCEFGLIGAGLLVAIFVLLLLKIKFSGEWKTPLVIFGMLGTIGILIHSLIDLPFRSPPVIIAFPVILAGFGTLRRNTEKILKENESPTKSVKGFIYFYSILFLFICIIGWWVSIPLRERVSRNIEREVEIQYSKQLSIPRYDNITPGISKNASPSMLRKLWWTKLLYSEYKEIHILSAKINFDLYRNSITDNEKKSKSYLKEAFRNTMQARRYTSYKDIEFIKLHTAILDALGYHLEESWCIKCMEDNYPNNIRVNLLLREYYYCRPYLIR